MKILMKFAKLMFKRDTLPPMLALIFASVACAVLVAVRVVWTKNISYAPLIWNVFLAWMPLVFAILAREMFRAGQQRNWRFYCLAGAWLLFFPNAPYIFTDLIHLWTQFFRNFWVDLSLILLCALTGLVLGFVSLYLMQSVVARMFGRVVSWLFVATALGLSSFGVYLGRFLRFNSWDVILKPRKLYHGIDSWTDRVSMTHTSVGFLFFFAVFLFIGYVMLYALTHLPRSDEFAASVQNAKAGPPLCHG